VLLSIALWPSLRLIDYKGQNILPQDLSAQTFEPREAFRLSGRHRTVSVPDDYDDHLSTCYTLVTFIERDLTAGAKTLAHLYGETGTLGALTSFLPILGEVVNSR